MTRPIVFGLVAIAALVASLFARGDKAFGLWVLALVAILVGGA
jgi:hypothetical protein